MFDVAINIYIQDRHIIIINYNYDSDMDFFYQIH